MTTSAKVPGSSSPFEVVRLLKDPIRFLEERQKKYGQMFRTRLGTSGVFMVSPDANRSIMITERDKFSYREGYGAVAFGRLFAGSLLLKDGEEHKKDRDVLQPAVGRLGLGHAVERVQTIWSKAIEASSGQTVDAYDYAQQVTFDVSANALVDLELDELDAWREPFATLVEGTMAPLPIRVPGGKLDKGLRARERLVEMLRPRIEDARTREPRGMVGLLAHHKDERGQPLDAETIAGHVLLLFWAGYDTTASTGSWILRWLGRFPDWQEKLAAERAEVLGTDVFDLDRQGALKQHQLFLKEVERLSPAILLFPRRLVEDFSLGPWTVKKGTRVFYSPYLTHRSQAYEDAEAFRPERWASGGQKVHAQALVGFGGGPRICLGKSFALMQLLVLLTTLLEHHRVELVDDGTTLGLPVHRPLGCSVRLRAL